MGLLADLVRGFNHALESYLAWLLGPPPWPVFLIDLKFWVGVACWLGVWGYWHMHPNQKYELVKSFPLKGLMVMGANLVILAMLQSVGAWGLLGLLLINYTNFKLTGLLFGHKGVLEVPQDNQEVPFKGDSMYEDFEAPLSQIVTIFVGQGLLFCFVVYAGFIKYKGIVNYGYWIVGYVAVQMSGFINRGADSQLGKTWSIERFRSLVEMNSEVAFKLNDKWVSKDNAEMILRHRMGLIVNTFFRDVITFLTPLLLMQSKDAMDFVQNAFAVSYISKLDDMNSEKEFLIRRRDDPTIPEVAHEETLARLVPILSRPLLS